MILAILEDAMWLFRGMGWVAGGFWKIWVWIWWTTWKFWKMFAFGFWGIGNLWYEELAWCRLGVVKSMMWGFEIIAVATDVEFEVGKWSERLLLSGVGVLAMIAKFVNLRSYPFHPSFQQSIGIIVQWTCFVQQRSNHSLWFQSNQYSR